MESMDPTLPSSVPLNHSLPPTPVKSKNKLLVIFGTMIILLIILIIGGSVYYQSSQLKNTTSAPAKSKTITISGLDVAKQTASFLDKAMLPDGNFVPFYLCSNSLDTAKGCQPAASPSARLAQRNGFIIAAYLELFKATNNSQYKNNADKAISYILTNCNIDVNFCVNSLPALYDYYKLTNDQKYKDAMLKASIVLMEDNPISHKLLEEKAEYFWMLYDITGDNRFKDTLNNVAQVLITDQFDKSETSLPDLTTELSLFYKEGDVEVRGYQILATDWYIAAFKATNNPIYLKAAQDFFTKAKVDQHLDAFKNNPKISDLSTLEYLLDTADSSTGTEKQIYQQQAQIFAQGVLSNIWDNPNDPKLNKDYGFLDHLIPDRLQPIKGSKLLIYNGLRVSQFLRLSDRTFHLP